MDRERDYANAVVRACDILRSFHEEGESLSLNELVNRARLSKTTTYRLIQSLVRGGMVERIGKGIYQSRIRPVAEKIFRIGFAKQNDSAFGREVEASLDRAAACVPLHLVKVNNRYSAREALRNAELLIRERVDLVIEYQTYEKVAPAIASKFQEAKIPVIAMEFPHPGATYFGANNYQAGLIAGRALGKWAREHWDGVVERILLLELPIAGPVVRLRITGFVEGLRRELPAAVNVPITHLDGKGDFEQILSVIRRHLRRIPAKRTLVGTVNDICALAAVRGFEEAGCSHLCAIAGQNATPEARMELRRANSPLIGSVAFFPERYGDQLIPLALSVLQKKSPPTAVFIEHQLITPRNVRAIYPLDGHCG